MSIPSVDEIEETILETIEYLNATKFADKEIFELTRHDYFRPVAQAIYSLVLAKRGKENDQKSR